MSLFDVLGSIYTKNKIKGYNGEFSPVILVRYLSLHPDNLEVLRGLGNSYLYVSNLHAYYMLFALIPKKQKAPFIKMDFFKKQEDEEVITKIKEILELSSKDFNYYRPILLKTILNNIDYWKSELGIDNDKPIKKTRKSNKKK